jgi:hypothetical protein
MHYILSAQSRRDLLLHRIERYTPSDIGYDEARPNPFPLPHFLQLNSLLKSDDSMLDHPMTSLTIRLSGPTFSLLCVS